MLLEAVNSVFLTFLATEYLLLDNHGGGGGVGGRTTAASNDDGSTTAWWKRLAATIASRHSRPLQWSFVAVASVNAFVRFHDAGAALAGWAHDRVETLFRLPRVAVAALSFLTALYFDCRRQHRLNARSRSSAAPWSNSYFFMQVAESTCKLLPVYPFLAVVISFGFLFVISAFEKLHLPLRILNGPIYYG